MEAGELCVKYVAARVLTHSDMFSGFKRVILGVYPHLHYNIFSTIFMGVHFSSFDRCNTITVRFVPFTFLDLGAVILYNHNTTVTHSLIS